MLISSISKSTVSLLMVFTALERARIYSFHFHFPTFGAKNIWTVDDDKSKDALPFFSTPKKTNWEVIFLCDLNPFPSSFCSTALNHIAYRVGRRAAFHGPPVL